MDLELKGDDPRQVLQDRSKVLASAPSPDLGGIWVITAKAPSKVPAMVRPSRHHRRAADLLERSTGSRPRHWCSLLSRELETTLLARRKITRPESRPRSITDRPLVALAAIAAAMRCSVEIHGRLVALKAAPRTAFEPDR